MSSSFFHQRNVTAVAFAATMALAGFLLFQVQPLLAKYILPWFGGSASTWLVCMLFFQVALLAGYTHAYALTLPFSVSRQAQIQIAVLAVSLLLLPITPSEAWKPQDAANPTWRIVALLAVCVGLPYVALATTTPLLSRWLARIEPSLDPARFFAASNLGSFVGLLSYPFAVERVLSSGAQTQLWSWAYVLYVALFAACGIITLARTKGDQTAEAAPLAADTGRDPLALWVGYAALGSVLLLATTNAITQWSPVLPFLWIVPLSLYLLTFVIAFGNPRIYDRLAFGAAFLLLAGSTFFFAPPETTSEFMVQLALQSATLFAGCMLCHGEVVRLQPHPARLPRFYLAIAAGGALGGLFVSVIAPLVFNDYFEHPLVLCAIAAVAALLAWCDGRLHSAKWIAAAGAVAGIYFLAGLGAGTWRDIVPERTLVERARNFYGVVKIVRESKDDPREHNIIMQQTGVDQSAQFQHPERRTETTCGFDGDSGLGLALSYNARRRAGPPQVGLRIGIVGLGGGMISALGREGDTIRFYELNPAVLRLADRHFTFRQDSKAKTDVLLGDGRLVLERQLKSNAAQAFDVLVLNAFRGASPPMHLMTKEAFDIYLGHLAADGILAVNFEFEIFKMAPLHRGMAKRLGIDVRWFEPKSGSECDGAISWALYTRDRAFFMTPQVRAAISPWHDRDRTEVVWTDGDSNLMSIINWRGQ